MGKDQRSGRGLGKAEQGAETRAKLIDIATRLFAKHGYAATSTDRILRGAGVTRGALYHHFGDKADLMRAVCEARYEEITRRILARARGATDAWSGLVTGCHAFLEIVAEPELVRVLFVDGPAVLGWDEWDAIERRHGFQSLLDGIARSIADGALVRQPVMPLGILLNGALNEAVVWAARQPDRDRAVRAVRRAFDHLLDGLRPRGPRLPTPERPR